jgi:DNA invertase Pin-like site-specific DNA recombinase
MGVKCMRQPWLIGYARVSTQEQNLELQLTELEKLGCHRLYHDKLSGKNKARPGLQTALAVLREQDTLVLWKLDRLGRTVKGLIELINKLSQEGVHFKSITDQVDTSTPSGRFFFHIMASLAQMERELLAERTKAGLAAAKAKGKLGGRKRTMTKSKLKSAKKLLTAGIPAKEVAKNLGVSIPTLYRWVPASSWD